MMSAIDWTPVLRVALMGALVAGPALLWLVLRHRQATLAGQLHALVWLTMFFTLDLIVVGAFTRLTDSGLGCPDWPGCYGHASPLGAHAPISAAQAAMPTGPVTHEKAWVEMVHRYLATGVGALIAVLAVSCWGVARRRSGPDAPPSAAGAGAALAWVCVQGAFGALTVTLKLYPLIVTLHLLGGMGLLVLLCVLSQRRAARLVGVPRGVRRLAGAMFLLTLAQAGLGGWVSSNYAVLACTGFPACNGQWWPPMDFVQGFTPLHPLGVAAQGGFLSHEALAAIHWTHRAGAAVVLTGLATLAALLWNRKSDASRFGRVLAALALWQFASGLSNVVLGWPLAAALAHTAGAAVLVAVLAAVWVRSAAQPAIAFEPQRAAPAMAASHPQHS